MSENGAGGPDRAVLILRTRDPSTLDEIAEAVSVAGETERWLYVERFEEGWRWSLGRSG